MSLNVGDVVRYQWQIFAERNFMNRGYNLYARARVPGQQGVYLKNIVVEIAPEENEAVAYPPVQLGEEDAQSLINALWEAGLRPNDGEGTMAHTSVLREFVEFLKTQNTQLLDSALKPCRLAEFTVLQQSD